MSRKGGKGHNVNEVVSAEALKKIVSRIEHIEEEISALSDDRKAVYADAKAGGFNLPALKRVIREKTMDQEKLQLYRESLSLYRDALGFEDTPLGSTANDPDESGDNVRPVRGKKSEVTDPPKGSA